MATPALMQYLDFAQKYMVGGKTINSTAACGTSRYCNTVAPTSNPTLCSQCPPIIKSLQQIYPPKSNWSQSISGILNYYNQQFSNAQSQNNATINKILGSITTLDKGITANNVTIQGNNTTLQNLQTQYAALGQSIQQTTSNNTSLLTQNTLPSQDRVQFSIRGITFFSLPRKWYLFCLVLLIMLIVGFIAMVLLQGQASLPKTQPAPTTLPPPGT